jgi:hypothetical protein
MHVRKRDWCHSRETSLGLPHIQIRTVSQGITIMLKRIALAMLVGLISASPLIATARDTRLGYDPGADPFAQYHAAIEQAKAEHKLVLVIAGGDWCHWCHALNRFVTTNSDVDTALHDTFVVMKVYVGDENYNEFFFSQLPEARGAPHFWIISPDRNVLASQSTGSFERGKRGYDKQEFLQFVNDWKSRNLTLSALPQQQANLNRPNLNR